MDNQTLQRIKDVLNRSQKVAIAVGKNPSLDDMGAALALYLSLQSMGKAISVLSATEPLVEIANLVGIDKVKTRFEGTGADLVVSFPYKEGEIEKVSYTIENGFLNIVVKAGEQGLNFSEQEVKYARGGGNGQLDLLITVGTARLSDIQPIFDMETLKDVTILNIDNKQENQGYGDIILVSPRFSSVSEQIAQLLEDLQVEMDVDAAQNLMDGISYATENFQSSQTSYLAFQMAGVLMRQGAIRTRVAVAAPPVAAPRSFQQPVQQPRRQQNSMQPQQNRDAGQDRRQPSFDQRRQQPAQSRPMPQPQQRPMQQPQQQAPQQQVSQQPAPQQRMPMQQRPAPQQEQQMNTDDFDNPPSDWLTPKVYKGSTNI